VVATLWKVDDEATSLLMTEFYKNMRTMATLDALREAQISVSRNSKFQHPYYWAGQYYWAIGDRIAFKRI
jgi:CHAT domain-containing protein